MAGSLIKLEEVNVTSAVASVTLGDDKWDTSYDVYMVRYNNVQPATDNRSISVRVTESGTPNTTANYDYAYKALISTGSFGNGAFTNSTSWQYIAADGVGTGTSESANGIIYCFNFNNASEYSFITLEMTELNWQPIARGNQGGGVHTVASASDGLYFFDTQGGNIASGTFTLYGLKK